MGRAAGRTARGAGAGQLLRGELETFPDEVRIAFTRATSVVPDLFLWLSARYLEHRSGMDQDASRVSNTFLASRGIAPAPDPLGPPAIVFNAHRVDQRARRRVGSPRGLVAPAQADAAATPATSS